MNIRGSLLILVVVLLLIMSGAGGAMHDNPIDEKPVALMNGIAHLGNGETIENSVITFEQGEITLVADARLVRIDLRGYEIIDISGKHVYLVKDCSKKKKRKCFEIIANLKTRQLTENEPANLLVTANEFTCEDNSIVQVFIKGQKQQKDQFLLDKKYLKHK